MDCFINEWDLTEQKCGFYSAIRRREATREDESRYVTVQISENQTIPEKLVGDLGWMAYIIRHPLSFSVAYLEGANDVWNALNIDN